MKSKWLMSDDGAEFINLDFCKRITIDDKKNRVTFKALDCMSYEFPFSQWHDSLKTLPERLDVEGVED